MTKRKSISTDLDRFFADATGLSRFDDPFEDRFEPLSPRQVPKAQKAYGFTRCAHSHPALPLPEGLVIYGGSCSDPIVLDADVYIGFETSMRRTPRRFPWNPGFEVLFPVSDMHAPANTTEFRSLVEWTIERLRAGDKVHAGCIGGHGRTGTFLAAIVAVMKGADDPIRYVREAYCGKAVESREQVAFLVREYGCKPVDGAKEPASAPAASWYKPGEGSSFGVTRKKGRVTQILYDPGSDKTIW